MMVDTTAEGIDAVIVFLENEASGHDSTRPGLAVRNRRAARALADGQDARAAREVLLIEKAAAETELFNAQMKLGIIARHLATLERLR
jgi:hypothetical protein